MVIYKAEAGARKIPPTCAPLLMRSTRTTLRDGAGMP